MKVYKTKIKNRDIRIAKLGSYICLLEKEIYNLKNKNRHIIETSAFFVTFILGLCGIYSFFWYPHEGLVIENYIILFCSWLPLYIWYSGMTANLDDIHVLPVYKSEKSLSDDCSLADSIAKEIHIDEMAQIEINLNSQDKNKMNSDWEHDKVRLRRENNPAV